MSDPLDTSVHSLESVSQVCGDTMAFRGPIGGVADPHDIVDHVSDCPRVQCEDSRLGTEGAQDVVQLARRNGTNMTEVLGQDQIGLRLPQQMVFQPVELLS
jgi:hypothetical protein